MKYVCLLLTLATIGFAADRPKTTECFKVNWLLRADEEHYWANWTNKCGHTIDSIYVLVRFADGGNQTVGNGVWGLHFVVPGESRVTRFSTPAHVADFHSVHVHKITTNWEEALKSGQNVERTFAPTRPTGDPGPRVLPARPQGVLLADEVTQ